MHKLHHVRRRALVVVAGLVAAVALGHQPSSSAEPNWAPESAATIRPGVQVIAEGQCTANFVFYDAAGNVYLGQAAHCTRTDGSNDAGRCAAPSLPLGTPITISGASKPGTLAYNSWIAMQEAGDLDSDACANNDFALVRVDPADVGRVNPTIPLWGGPMGLTDGSIQSGDVLYGYGNSSLRQGLTLLGPKKALSLGDVGGGWGHIINSFVTPGLPGDSGSPFLDIDGKALGVLTTLRIGVPSGVTNSIVDLPRALAYAQTHSSIAGLRLANGTRPFDHLQLPLDLLDPILGISLR